jgi:hypothetical protein
MMPLLSRSGCSSVLKTLDRLVHPLRFEGTPVDLLFFFGTPRDHRLRGSGNDLDIESGKRELSQEISSP